MKVVRSSRFDRAYRKLDPEVQKLFKKKLRLLLESNFQHPSLRGKRIRGTARIWEASVDMDHRFTFEMIKDGILLRVIGKHTVLSHP